MVKKVKENEGKTLEEKYDMVIVRWLDHTGDSAWLNMKQIEDAKPAEVVTVGWIILEDDKYIKIADSLVDDGTYGGMSLILKECVIDITELDFMPEGETKH